jgi:hypothetical protein
MIRPRGDVPREIPHAVTIRHLSFRRIPGC